MIDFQIRSNLNKVFLHYERRVSVSFLFSHEPGRLTKYEKSPKPIFLETKRLRDTKDGQLRHKSNLVSWVPMTKGTKRWELQLNPTTLCLVGPNPNVFLNGVQILSLF